MCNDGSLRTGLYVKVGVGMTQNIVVLFSLVLVVGILGGCAIVTIDGRSNIEGDRIPSFRVFSVDCLRYIRLNDMSAGLECEGVPDGQTVSKALAEAALRRRTARQA